MYIVLCPRVRGLFFDTHVQRYRNVACRIKYIPILFHLDTAEAVVSYWVERSISHQWDGGTIIFYLIVSPRPSLASSVDG